MAKSNAPTTARTPTPDGTEKYGLHFLNKQQFDIDISTKDQLYSVDIVAVHGFNGHPYDTWTAENSKKVWLRDYLPAELPGARVFSFGYSSEIGLTRATGKLEDFARSLLNGLGNVRCNAEVYNRF